MTTVPRTERVWATLLGSAMLAQGVMLVYLGRLSGRAAWQCVVMALALGWATREAWLFRGGLNHRVDMVMVMAALGGLGMIIGWWVDFGCRVAPEWLRLGLGSPHPARLTDKVFSFMTAGMLLGGIPASFFLTRCASLARGNWRRSIATHVLGNAGMLAGMIGFNRLYGRALGSMIGSFVVGAHLAMVVGMVAGMVAISWLGEAVLGLRPWREEAVPLELDS